MTHGIDGLAARVAACEQENQRLREIIKRQNLLWVGALLVAAASLIAGPSESGTGVLNLRSKDSSLELRTDLDGARMSVNQGRVVAQQIPAIEALSEASCRNWREIDKQHPGENACRSRYTESACKRCLDQQEGTTARAVPAA